MEITGAAPTSTLDLTATAEPDAVAACRQAIVTRAADNADAILELVAGAIFRELPEYGTGRSRGEIEDIRTGIRRSIELCLWTLAESRPITDDELSVLRATGGQRARQGISRQVVVASVRTAVRVGRTYLMGCTDASHDATVLLATHCEIGGMLDRFEDQAAAALAEGWDEAYRRLLAGGDRGSAILVDRLLARRFHDDEEVLAHAAEVGLARNADAWVVVAVRPPGAADDRSLADAAYQLASRMRLLAGPVYPTPRSHLPMVVQPAHGDPPPREVLERAAGEAGIVFVVADTAAGLTALSPTYRAIREGLPYLAAATSRPGVVAAAVVRFHHAMCSGTPADWRDLVDDVLRPLGAVSRREAADLLETLDALCEAGPSGAELARLLHVHKNTVNNRLRRAEQLLGLDLRRPAERLVLEGVMRLRRVVDAES